jgi:hypothetical protein
MRLALVMTAILGGVLCLVTVLLIGRHLPSELGLGQQGTTGVLLTGLVIATAVSTILDAAALVATRATPALAVKNLSAASSSSWSWSCWPGSARPG